MLAFPSVLFKTKSVCLSLFSAFSGAQVCESRIDLEIKIGHGQPFPSINFNVSQSVIGFRQKAIGRSSGQLFRGKKTSSFTVLKRSALSPRILPFWKGV